MGGRDRCVGRRAEGLRSVQCGEVVRPRAVESDELEMDEHAMWARRTHFSHWSHLQASTLL